MKITIVQGAFLPVPPLRGGAVEKIWFALGKKFAQLGHEVTHVSRAFAGLPREETLNGVRHIRVAGFDTPKSLILLKAFDLLYSIRVLRALPPGDILVTNTFWLPILVRSDRFGKLYVHVARYPKGQMRFYAHAARLQTVSNPIKEVIVTEVPQCRHLVECIANPLPEQESGNGRVSSSDRKRHLLYVGRVHPEKGLDLLLSALALIPDEIFAGWKLLIVGPADASAGGGGRSYLTALQQKAAAISERVEWIGPVYDAAQLAGYYRDASLFVYPSLAERGETFGLAPLEAMSHGCPALVSSLACFRDFITDEVTGFVFDHRTAEPVSTFAAAIGRLLGDSTRIDRIREAARSKTNDFTLDRIAERYLRDFHAVETFATPARP